MRFRLIWLPLSASALAILLAGLSVIDCWGPSACTYDGSLATLAATLVAVIWYTYFTYQSLRRAEQRDEQERLRARKALATGLLAEISFLEITLEQLYAKQIPASEALRHPLLDSAIAQAALFEPDTVAKLSEFQALILDVRSPLEQFREDPASMLGQDRGFWLARQRKLADHLAAKAGFAIQYIPTVARALQDAGGVLKPREPMPVVPAGQVPPLPDSPFGPRLKF